MATSALLQTTLGPYQILKKVGEGRVGTVYLAEDTRLGRRVALKVPHLGGEDPQALERFRRAGWLAASLTHPNVCTIFDVAQVEGVPFLVMEFLDGTPLADLMEKHQPWPVRRALSLVARLAHTLAEVHDKGVLHLGLQPGNVFLMPDDRPVLVDVGLAQTTHEPGQGQGTGTPPFVAPEQILGGPGTGGPAADVYALGVLLYQLLTGEPPFEGSADAVIAQTLSVPPGIPSALRATLTPGLDELCLKALAKRQEDRYSSMQAFADALAEQLRSVRRAESPAEGTAPPPVRAPARKSQRLRCPSCRKKLRIPPALEGKPLKCPRCRAPLGSAPSPPPLPQEPPVTVEDRPTLVPIPEAVPAHGLPYTTGELLVAGGTVGALLALLFWGVVGLVVLIL
jgi:serine/threonine protein kinase